MAPLIADLQQAIALHHAGDFAAALDSCDQAIAIAPDFAQAHLCRGNALTSLAQWDAALASYDRAIVINDEFVEAHFNRGVVLNCQGRLDASLASYARAIAIKPEFAAAHFNRGVVLYALKQLEAALASYDQAIALNPGHAEAHCNRGIVLEDLDRLEAALASFDSALAVSADLGEAHYNRGNVLRKLARMEAALASYDRAVSIRAGHAEAYYNRGNVLKELDRLDAALGSFDAAIALKPDYADAYANRGNVLANLGRYEAAIASYGEAMRYEPGIRFVPGQRCYMRMQVCDWRGLEREMPAVLARIEANEAASPPYPLLLLSESAALQKKAAQIWVREECPPNPSLPAAARFAPHGKIRIGYFSPDFRNHPVANLAAAMLETHDRSRFELTGFSLGSAREDGVTARVRAALDRFVDVRGASDREAALLARSLGLDIAVDLGGFTQGSRPRIFALRAAPLQVNFLGYPGTLGAGYVDYLVADWTVVPERNRGDYSEKIIYLPETCLPGDSRRSLADGVSTREEAGLPHGGFVFCCFNNSAKITAATFAGWMRILTRVPGSVLWLAAVNPTAVRNLRLEALAAQVNPDRLVFARRLDSMREHLARHRLADLFVDTLPYNAHATASDALWAGLPVLTLAGDTFAGRVAASLLTAARLPQLITKTQEQYERTAVDLASDAPRLAAIRASLAQNRLTTPLFDTRAFTRSLETAYATIHERYRADLPPRHIFINPE
jgi:predicted O-linked N-acetylglucosamine transferase (SPINDLY family)